MGRPRSWGSEQTGRPIMQSPGRPSVNQLETKRGFWNCIVQGMETEAAALACGVSHNLWGKDGFVRRAECRRWSWRRALGLICLFLNARKSRCCGHRNAGFVRSREDCSAHRRPSRASCAVTLQPAAVHCYTGRRLLSGKLSVPRNVRKLPDWQRTRD